MKCKILILGLGLDFNPFSNPLILLEMDDENAEKYHVLEIVLNSNLNPNMAIFTIYTAILMKL